MPSLSATFYTCLVVFGMAWIIADSKISIPVRKWIAGRVGEKSLFLTLIECPPCLSFWLGFFAGTFIFSTWAAALTLPWICAGFSIVFWTIVERNR